MSRALIHISGAEAVRDFTALLARVPAGEEIVLEGDAPAVVLRGRLLPESIALAESRGSSAVLDGGFAHELEEAVNSRPEPLDPRSWS